MLSFKLKFVSFLDPRWLCQTFDRSNRGYVGDDEVTNLWSADDSHVGGRGDGCPRHGDGRMLQLRRSAAAVRDLLSAAGGAAAIPWGGGDRHGIARQRRRTPDTATIS